MQRQKNERYLDQARRRIDELKAKIIQIPKAENEQANRLAKVASAEHMIPLITYSLLFNFLH